MKTPKLYVALSLVIMLVGCSQKQNASTNASPEVAESTLVKEEVKQVVSGVSIGDKAPTFSLTGVNDEVVSLSDYTDSEGLILVFTCNHCPYSVMYEDRIIELQDKFGSQGFPVVAINPNDPEVVPEDGFAEMKVRASEKNFNFPYLFDADQKVYPKYGATRTPHFFILNRTESDFIVEYIGALDDNHSDANAVKVRYVEDAIQQLKKGVKPAITSTKAIGCSIKKQS